jgi:diphthamide biosynthesis methyltransferase
MMRERKKLMTRGCVMLKLEYKSECKLRVRHFMCGVIFNLTGIYHILGGSCSLHHRVKNDFWGTSVTIYQTTQRHVPQDTTLNIHRPDNLKYHTIIFLDNGEELNYLMYVLYFSS